MKALLDLRSSAAAVTAASDVPFSARDVLAGTANTLVCLGVAQLATVLQCEADVWPSLGNVRRNGGAEGGGGGGVAGSGNWSHNGHHVAPQTSRPGVL